MKAEKLITKNINTNQGKSACFNRRNFLKSGGMLAMALWSPLVFGYGCGKEDRVAPTDEENEDNNNDENKVNPFDFETKTVLLNSGYKMPILGIGTYLLSNTQAENSVYNALSSGYRLIDTAAIYGNETGVGNGIRRSNVPRSEIFVTTKLWTADFADADRKIDERLQRLGVDYIDLLLLHHSAPNDQIAYKAMEQAVKDGRLRSIGLSNFYEPEFTGMMEVASIIPAVVQNETHPYNQGKSMKQFLQPFGTILESWFPLGGRGNTQVLFYDTTIAEIAKNHDKTSAQILLRWHLQAGNIAIPGSSNPEHIKENITIFDFELTDTEMQRIDALDKKRRFANY